MWPIQLPFFLVTVCRMFLSFLTLYKYSFLMWLVELISILLQHHISTHSRYFLSIFWNVQFSAIQSYVSDVAFYYFLNVSRFTGEKSLRLIECCSCHDSPAFHFTCTSCIICCQATQMFEMLHICQLLMISMICTGMVTVEVLIATCKLIIGYHSDNFYRCTVHYGIYILFTHQQMHSY